MRKKKQQVICIMGPTASGKTDLALALGEQIPSEIINVDSALVYRGLDIGSAKPGAEELARVPHHLIDIRDPAQVYSAAEFYKDASKAIEEIISRGKVALLVGGTMLYFKALLQGLSDMPESDPGVRAEIEKQAADNGWQSLHAELEKIDPAMAAGLHPNHSQRISRALEVYRICGKTMTELRSAGSEGLADRYDWLQLAIAPRDRSVLHQRIEKRFKRMIELGFLDEVRLLFERGDLSMSVPSIRAVGYRQAWQHLNGELSAEEMTEKAIAATRQLAKRQLTWLRSWSSLKWIYTQDISGKNLDQYEILRQALNFLPKRSI